MSEIETIHDALQDRFGGETILALRADAIDPWIEVAPEAIAEICLFLKTDPRFAFDHLNDLCGVDYCERPEGGGGPLIGEPRIEVVYQLSSLKTRKRCTLKVLLPRWKEGRVGEIPDLPTVSGVWAIADWHERECFDLVGVRFVGHPNLTRILCAEDWIGHALRKDYEFPLEYHGIRCR